MTRTITISFVVDIDDPTASLVLEVWIDDTKFVDTDELTFDRFMAAASGSGIVENTTYSIEIPDDSGEHELKFILKNKTALQTVLDAEGNIISDATLTISNLAFDEIELGQLVTELATYTHDFNGTKEATQGRFYGKMGCNGTVSLKFNTPIYLWLLENM
jgi:hypothetical protein